MQAPQLQLQLLATRLAAGKEERVQKEPFCVESGSGTVDLDSVEQAMNMHE